MDNQLKEIKVVSEESYKIGYGKAKEDIRLIIEQQVENIENESTNVNRHMNDLEYGAYTKLLNVLDFIEDM